MSQLTSQDNSLPQSAKRFIVGVCVIGGLILVSAALNSRGGDPLTLSVWVLAAALAGTMKVRFPGIESSYSFGYVAVLAAISMLRFPEAILISLATMVVQCYWHTLKRPLPIQVLFNVCSHAISAGAAWTAFHGLQDLVPVVSMPLRFSFAAGIFFIANTGSVSGILAILTGRDFMDVWQNSHLLIFPYYLVGAACAAAIAWQSDTSAFAMLLVILPILGMLYASMRGWVRRIGTCA